MTMAALPPSPTDPATLYAAAPAAGGDPAQVAAARRVVRRWAAWLVAPLAMLAAAAAVGLDRGFVAVGLLYASVIAIRLVQAWGDYDLAVRHADGTTTRADRRLHRSRNGTAAAAAADVQANLRA